MSQNTFPSCLWACLCPAPMPKGRRLTVMVLGVGESGKSTLIRQFERLQDSPEDTGLDQKQIMRPFVLSNFVEGACKLIKMSITLGKENPEYRFSDKDSLRAVMTFLVDQTDGAIDNTSNWTLEYSEKDTETAGKMDRLIHVIRRLANEPGKFENMLSHRDTPHIPDGWTYFLQKLREDHNWGNEEWLPTSDDLLHTRKRTVGINARNLVFDRQRYAIVDVGGQKNERNKWTTFFKKADLIIWMQSLSCYDLNAYENQEINRLEDSLEEFKKLMDNKELGDIKVLIFLNKEDLLQKKFCERRVPIALSSGKRLEYEEHDVNSDESNIKAVKETIYTWLTEDLSDEQQRRILGHYSLSALDRKTVDVMRGYLLRATVTDLLDDIGFVKKDKEEKKNAV